MICETHFPRDRNILKTYVDNYFELKEKLETEPQPDSLLAQLIEQYSHESEHRLVPQHMLETHLAKLYQLAHEGNTPFVHKRLSGPELNKRVLDIGLIRLHSKDFTIKESMTSRDELKTEELKLSFLRCSKSILEQQMTLVQQHLHDLLEITSPDLELDFYLKGFRKNHARLTTYIKQISEQMDARSQHLQTLTDEDSSLTASLKLAAPQAKLYQAILDVDVNTIGQQLQKLAKSGKLSDHQITYIMFAGKWSKAQRFYKDFSVNEWTYKLTLIKLLWELLDLLGGDRQKSAAKTASSIEPTLDNPQGIWDRIRALLNL